MRRVSSPVFVGREIELARLDEVFDEAANGHGTFLLVAGEAGVGKTRFAEESSALARARGYPVLRGSCLDLGGDAQAFAPLREALRRLRAEVDPETFARLLGTGGRDLAVLLSGTEVTRPRLETLGMGAESGQAKLFDAWLGLLRQLGSNGPPLFIVEDLHWADRSTFDLVRFLAHNDVDVPFLVLATFRSDELHRTHPLMPVLAELQRKQSVVRLQLARFEQSETAELVRAIRGSGVDAALIDLIHERSDGNAFYVEELAGAEATGAAALPDSLREILLAKVGTLTAQTQELLRTASVGAPDVSTRLLEQVMGRQATALEPSLDEAVDRHLLVPVDDPLEERFAFRHALVQEAIQGELLPGQRARLHALFAAAIEASGSGLDASMAAVLAHHWFAAHDLPRALEASLVAAELAQAIHAFGDAYAQYERAFELWDRVPEPERRPGTDRIALLEGAARTAEHTAPARALDLMREAVRLGTGRVDDLRMASLMGQIGRYAWTAGDGATALEACRTAVRLVPADPPSVIRARVLASLGQILMVTMQSSEAKRICEEAVATARAVGARQIEAHALNSLGTTNAYLGDLETGLQQLQDSLDLALSIGSADDVARAQNNRIDILSNSGRFEEAGQAALESFVHAEANGLVRLFGVLNLSEAAMAFYRGGSWAAASSAVERARRYAVSGAPEIMVGGRAALLEVGQGRFDEAAATLDRVGRLIGRALEGQLIEPIAEAAAELALWQGRPADARTEALGTIGRLPNT
ncbi:MAG: AAA family ATPase, partial [Chloroflexota bacterium]